MGCPHFSQKQMCVCVCVCVCVSIWVTDWQKPRHTSSATQKIVKCILILHCKAESDLRGNTTRVRSEVGWGSKTDRVRDRQSTLKRGSVSDRGKHLKERKKKHVFKLMCIQHKSSSPTPPLLFHKSSVWPSGARLHKEPLSCIILPECSLFTAQQQYVKYVCFSLRQPLNVPWD